MFGGLKKRLDLWAISAACKLSQTGVSQPGQVQHARELLARQEFLHFDDLRSLTLDFQSPENFTFPSPDPSPWKENNLVRGHYFRTGTKSGRDPTLILLHGWNAELCYRHLFPYIGRRARKHGFNTLFFELPLHSQRRPRAEGAVKDWISDDVFSMLRATRQALCEIEGLARWLKSQGSSAVVTWGFSLGAWLAGLHLCQSPSIEVAVLATPVARMDLIVETLAFCAPVRNALGTESFDFSKLNLRSHQPRIDPKNILLIASQYDQFTPPETIEELHQRWQGSELWRVAHGHISLLCSLPHIERTLHWLQTRPRI